MDKQQRQLQLMRLLGGMMSSQAICTAAKLEIADRLGDGMKSVSQLAQETHTHEASLSRLLRALASMGIFAQEQSGMFTNTELSSLLRSDHPASLHDTACWFGCKAFWQSWGSLEHSIKTGKQAFEHVFYENIWSYFASHPDEAEQFNRAMISITGYEDLTISQAYDFSSQTIADIGGGYGQLLTSILTSCSQARGILFDTAAVIEQAKEQIQPQLRERVHLIAGSFLESVPAGADVYLLKSILHDWPDEQCVTILQNCRRAMGPDGKVLVIDRVVPQTNDPEQAETFFIDLIMLAMFGGHERSEQQMEQLYAQAGLRLTRLIATKTPGVHLIEGVAVDRCTPEKRMELKATRGMATVTSPIPS